MPYLTEQYPTVIIPIHLNVVTKWTILYSNENFDINLATGMTVRAAGAEI